MISNIISGAIGGVITLIVVGAYNTITDEADERKHVELVNAEINSSYNSLCLYFGTQDHYEHFDPYRLFQNMTETMEKIVEQDLLNIERDKKHALLAIALHAKNNLDVDLFRKTHDRSDEIGDSLFSGFSRFEKIYFDLLRDLDWLELPTRECRDYHDFFFNTR